MPPARTAAVLAAACVLLGACTSGDEPVVAATESPSPSPTIELTPVAGERIVTVTSTSNPALLGLGEPVPVEQEAVDNAVLAIGDWLDGHLDRLQRQGGGTLNRVLADDLEGVGPERAVITTGLADTDAPVAAARYHFNTYHDGGPEMIAVHVEVTHHDGTTSSAGMVFTIDADGAPKLILFGPEDPTGDASAPEDAA